ncbi:hypothetical protein HU200_016676 [Digitaria exilis]|uniref:Bifunctional inhibitor/plant lipid transfer protein/seed storage helical domain-containing protein n=1 Tax=Digitaria exilis TaxID=1010633 RepID=A0A835F860_9POAL|nr:hypothetical protein HU200_016676 [Digitaria exilis]
MCAIISFDHATSKKLAGCTNMQKEAILRDCREFIRHGNPYKYPPVGGLCCVAVRSVPFHNMVCIVKLLKQEELKEHDREKVRTLQYHCDSAFEQPHLVGNNYA